MFHVEHININNKKGAIHKRAEANSLKEYSKKHP